MNLDAVRAGDKAKDIVPENRVAALGHLVIQAFDVFGIEHQDVVLGLTGAALFGLGHDGLCRFYGRGMARFLTQDIVLDLVHVQRLIADSGIEARERGIVQLFAQFREHFVRKFQLPVLQAALQDFLAIRGTGEFLCSQGLLHFAAGLGRDHPVNPVRCGMLVFAGLDFHYVSGVQFFTDAHRLAIHTGPYAMRANIGVDAKSEVQHRGAGAQDTELTGGGEHKDFLVRRLRKVLRVV